MRNKAVFTAGRVPGVPALADPGPGTPGTRDPGSDAQAIGGVYWGTGWSGTTPQGGAFVGSKCTRVDSGPGGTGATLTAASCAPSPQDNRPNPRPRKRFSRARAARRVIDPAAPGAEGGPWTGCPASRPCPPVPRARGPARAGDPNTSLSNAGGVNRLRPSRHHPACHCPLRRATRHHRSRDERCRCPDCRAECPHQAFHGTVRNQRPTRPRAPAGHPAAGKGRGRVPMARCPPQCYLGAAAWPPGRRSQASPHNKPQAGGHAPRSRVNHPPWARGAWRRRTHTAPARCTRNTAPARSRIPPVVSSPGLATRAPRCRGSRARQPPGAPATQRLRASASPMSSARTGGRAPEHRLAISFGELTASTEVDTGGGSWPNLCKVHKQADFHGSSKID